MNSEVSYILLIGLIIFLFIKKTLAVVIEARTPEITDLDNSPQIWTALWNFRRVFNVISIFALSYFLITYNLNKHIKIVFLLLLFISFEYFIVDERFIYYFISETPDNKLIINLIDKQLDLYIDLFCLIYSIYALNNIF